MTTNILVPNLSHHDIWDTWIKPVWPRQRLDQTRVQEFSELYREGGPGALPPILVVKTSTGAYLLADGIHRLCAAYNIGMRSIPAEVIDNPPRR